jgi:hypothetical protein
MEVIDNFLEKNLIEHLEKVLVYDTPHFYNQRSDGKNLSYFYINNINTNDTFISFVIKKLKDIVSFKEILRCYINIQFNGMDGDWHQDDGSKTILLMVTNTLSKNSGQFQIKIDNEIKSVDFVQNRLICFNSTYFHRGLAPKEINVPRITLAFKTT